MARNIFSIYDLSILLKLSILFVGKVKITPFNGSIFFNGSSPFLCGTVKVLGVDETEGATMLDQYWEMRMCMYY